jgi:hypothetical protein
MADNIQVTPGTGATIAADNIASVLHQRVKLSLGADGVANDAAAGAGVVGVDTQRVTLASNDPAVVALGEVQASPTPNTVLDRLKALLTGISLAAGSNIVGKVGVQVGGSDVADAHPVPVVEGNSAAPITGASMPAGGVGLTGWLSAIWTRLAGVTLASGSAVIGKIGIDQTTPGSTNLVATNADAAIGAGTAPAKSHIAGGVYNSPAPTLTAGQTAALQLDADGSLYSNVRDWTVSSATVLGKVSVDQTTPGTTNLIATNADGTVTPGTAPSKSFVSGGVYNASGPTYTEGQCGAHRHDVKGRLIITQEKRATYSACISSLTVASNPTDFFEIYGAVGKTIIVKRIRVSGTSSGTQQVLLILLKRSTANSGGTPVAVTAVPHDSTNAAASAVVRAYTANPTTGTLVGSVRAPLYTMVAASSNYVCDLMQLEFGTEEDQGIILRGTGEGLCLNLGGVSVSGSMFNISVEWREVVE